MASILSPTSANHCKAESLDDSKSSNTAIGVGRGVGKRGRGCGGCGCVVLDVGV